MNLEEQNNFIGDIISILAIILFGLLILPAILIVLLFAWMNSLFTNEEQESKKEKVYRMPCGQTFTESDIEESNKKIQRARADKKRKKR